MLSSDVVAGVARDGQAISANAALRLLAWTVADARGATVALDGPLALTVGKRLDRQAQSVRAGHARAEAGRAHRCLFDGGERRLAHHRSHTPQAASPATQPPAYPLEPLTPALPPLSTPPVCSWQANFARSTSSLATILESIVAYSTRCARWCARFLRPTRPRGTPAAAALLPAAGLPDHVFLSELRVGYRVSSVSRTVCHP